jgi:hypothetical protein
LIKQKEIHDMDRKRDPIEELDWLAYAARQRGWDDFADRIEADAVAAAKREDELEQRRLEMMWNDHPEEGAA